MRKAQRFNFVEGLDAFGVPEALPQLPLALTYESVSVEVSVLLDRESECQCLALQCLTATWCSLGRTDNLRDICW